jgi:hypothetical protein
MIRLLKEKTPTILRPLPMTTSRSPLFPGALLLGFTGPAGGECRGFFLRRAMSPIRLIRGLNLAEPAWMRTQWESEFRAQDW